MIRNAKRGPPAVPSVVSCASVVGACVQRLFLHGACQRLTVNVTGYQRSENSDGYRLVLAESQRGCFEKSNRGGSIEIISSFVTFFLTWNSLFSMRLM